MRAMVLTAVFAAACSGKAREGLDPGRFENFFRYAAQDDQKQFEMYKSNPCMVRDWVMDRIDEHEDAFNTFVVVAEIGKTAWAPKFDLIAETMDATRRAAKPIAEECQ